MSGRGDRGGPDYGRRTPPDYYRGPPPGPGYGGGGGGRGDYYGGKGPPGGGYRGPPPPRGPPPRGGPPFRGGGGGGGGGGPPPPRNNRRRAAPPPGVITFRSYEEERQWVENRRRNRLARPSKFDVMPTPEQQAAQAALLPLTAGAVAATTSAVPTMAGYPALQDPSSATDPSALPQQTRHARRLYVGNLPQFITEEQIHHAFRNAIATALIPPPNGDRSRPPYNIHEEDPILTVYINHERRFCFLEFKSVELCSACMALDGLEVVPGQPPVKVKRPNDYNAAIAPKITFLPELDVSRLGIISPTVLDGPNKIFIGGLHYHLTEGQVLELLQAFGKVKAFHLVKNEPESATSKGYCFVEYSDSRITPTAVAGLNGMDIGGGKSLTARLAGERHGTVAPILTPTNTTVVPPPPIVQQQAQVMATAGSSSNLPPERNIVNGYDIESLVDAALGQAPMPTGPTYLDAFGQPITRIMQIIPKPIATNPIVPALTPQQQAAINALTGVIPPVVAPPPVNVPGLTPQQIQAINALPPIPAMPNNNMNSNGIHNSNIHPTRVLVLLNMVTDEDLATDDEYNGLVEEIKEECAKYGMLRNIEVPRYVMNGVEPSAIRKVFLEYSTVDEAVKAESELAGRQFGPNVVETSFFPEADFPNRLR